MDKGNTHEDPPLKLNANLQQRGCRSKGESSMSNEVMQNGAFAQGFGLTPQWFKV
jgi:hypothetical protein